MSSSNCCHLSCIQVSQEAGNVVWYCHLIKNIPHFFLIHTVKGFSVVNEADFFLIPLLFSVIQCMLQFGLWFPCLFKIQFVHLEVLDSCTTEA